jgi:hypothetical protein
MLTPGYHSQGVLYIIRCAYVGKANKQIGISLIVIKHWKNILEIEEKSVSLHSLSKTKYRRFLPLVKKEGALAQVVEQWTENPCVLGSTPRGTTPPFILSGFPAMEFGLFLCLVMNLHLLFHRISFFIVHLSLYIASLLSLISLIYFLSSISFFYLSLSLCSASLFIFSIIA